MGDHATLYCDRCLLLPMQLATDPANITQAERHRNVGATISELRRSSDIGITACIRSKNGGATPNDGVEIIRHARLPEISKSSCWYCPAMKRSEIVALHHDHPDLFARALAVEDAFRSGLH